VEKQKRNINFKMITSRLKDVRYQGLEGAKGNFNVKMDDLIEPTHMHDNGFTLLFTRHIHLEPEGMFDMTISFEIKAHFDEDARNFFIDKRNQLEPFIEKVKDSLVRRQNVGNQMSLIVAQLTQFQGMNPIIIPPYPKPKA